MYETKLKLVETEKAIKIIKDKFEKNLAENLNILRVSAPLFVSAASGLNDDLSGIERAVSFDLKSGELSVIVHSLAKWKRMALDTYEFKPGTGLYTDMNAIRRDEDLDEIHSYYVDQWDWEKVILKEDRTLLTLEATVKKIYSAMKKAEHEITSLYPVLTKKLPEEIVFISSQKLEEEFPTLTPKEREHAIARKHGAVFITEIGHFLNSGNKHDGRAPDYDDWNLNGDIIVYYEPLDIGLELSSMGIRVDENSLKSQLKSANAEDRVKYDYHQRILNGTLPYTIGGGIGQSRFCLFLLDKLHIGEVQCSIWPKEMIEEYKKKNIKFL
jgi:aspartate--ammonia ligase